MTQSDYIDLLYEEIQKDKFFKSDEKALIKSIIYTKIPNPPQKGYKITTKTQVLESKKLPKTTDVSKTPRATQKSLDFGF